MLCPSLISTFIFLFKIFTNFWHLAYFRFSTLIFFNSNIFYLILTTHEFSMLYNLSDNLTKVWKNHHRWSFYPHLIMLSEQSYFCIFYHNKMIGIRSTFIHFLTKNIFSLKLICLPSPLLSLLAFFKNSLKQFSKYQTINHLQKG